ncbi:MAG: (Fe-S)-binding protein [Caldimicrobium sp.]
MNNERVFSNIYLEQAFCHKPQGCYLAKLTLPFEVKALLPYIKPKVKTLFYNPEENLIFKIFLKGKFYKVSLKEKELNWGIVSNREEAQEVLEVLLSFFKEILEKIYEIEPDFTPLRRPTALEIYNELPKKNCGECGEVSCLALAIKISMGERELSECPYME